MPRVFQDVYLSGVSPRALVNARGDCLAEEQGFAGAAAKLAEAVRSEPRSHAVVNRRTGDATLVRKAGVGRSAFVHRFPPRGGQRGRIPALRSVETGIVQEGWGDPFLHPEQRRFWRHPCCRCPSVLAIRRSPSRLAGSGGSEPIMGWLSPEQNHDVFARRVPAPQR